MKKFILVFSLISTFAFAHDHRHEARPNAGGGSGTDVLSEAEAVTRESQVEQVDYTLHFKFEKGAANFQGKARIDARLRLTKLPLRLDVWAESVQRVAVNGKEIPFVWENGHIMLPKSVLTKDLKVEVEYTGRFSPGMSGLYKVRDHSDGEDYLYTNLEPYGAHRVFPCFDQPDLKATYQVSVEKPADWKVITNTPATNEAGTEFARSLRFSTYIFFLGAGPYEVWRDEHQGLTLAIYARKSIARHVDEENLFDLTKRGLDFFQSYFDSAYPFPKYDHIFCPEFPSGAMENPGAVSMSERMIFKSPPNPSQVQSRANTLFHEMAHMWFGDLVTMKWWSDLWLNESFATYMASVALDRALGLGKSAWVDFAGSKGWAYWQDQLSTTHPIVVPVADTDAAETIFDGITYGKGAAAMKQLHYYVGEEGFRDGLRAYFRKYSWKNTEMSDFMDEIALASGKDLDRWIEGWLNTAGPSRVAADWDCAGGKISRFRLLQQRAEGNLPHKAKVGFFQRSQGRMQELHRVEAEYDGAATEVTSAIGLACPDFVYPNLEDEDYALFALDPASLRNLGGDVNQFTDPFVRQLLWSTLGQMVKDLKLKHSSFLEMALNAMEAEEDVNILGALVGGYGVVREEFPRLRPELLPTLGARIEAATWREVAEERSEAKRGLSLLWLEQYLHVAHTPTGAANLKMLLAGDRLSQDQRWTALRQLAHLGEAGVREMIRAEKLRDAGGAATYGYAAEVAIAEIENKRNFWAELTDLTNDLTYSQRNSGANSFHSPFHPELSAEFVDPFFALLARVDWDRDGYLSDVLMELFPGNLCSRDLLDRSRRELAASSMPESIKRSWIEANDTLEECVLTRALE